jgi:hypothetical protein
MKINTSSSGGAADFLATHTQSNRFTCLVTPLWSDEATWKIQVKLRQTGDYVAKTIERLENVPFPPEPGTRQLVRETTLFGQSVKIYAIGAIDPNAPLESRGGMAGVGEAHPFPSLFFEFAPQVEATNRARLRVKTDVTDDLHRRIAFASFGRTVIGTTTTWRIDFSSRELSKTEIKSVNVAFSLPEERTFEFLVKPEPAKAAVP